MKNQSEKRSASRGTHHWILVLAVQAVITLALFCLLTQSKWLGGLMHALVLWGVTPIVGFISACIATRKGLLNYAALLVPPLAQMAAGLIVWGYLPETGPVFLCAFVSLVGAATGEVLKRSRTR